MRTNILLFFILINISRSFCQMSRYEYKRQITGIKGTWNAVGLPDEIYNKVSPDLSDIRIYGITSRNDTIEAPYLFAKNEGATTDRNIDFKLINQSKKNKDYYFTFLVHEERTINQLNLNFSQSNYDWRIRLEGSRDQLNWFTVVDNYRILSIKNSITDYQFNKVIFPDSRYTYYRLGITANERPLLKSAEMTLLEATQPVLKKYILKNYRITQDKTRKQTIIDIELKKSVPVSRLKIEVKDKMDFYRPILIEYLTDSFKTDKSWYYNYNVAESATSISSLDKKDFEFSSHITNKILITIDNHDNRPLQLGTIEVEGTEKILIARLNEPSIYYLCYGRRNAEKPVYDLEQFSTEISDKVNKTILGNEVFVSNERSAVTVPLFMNKAWLWGIMALIIVILGWFTLKMMKNKE